MKHHLVVSGTTILLEELAKTVLKENLEKSKSIVNQSIEHQHLGQGLEACKKTLERIDLLQESDTGMTFLRECSLKAMDRLYAIGERRSSTLFSSVRGQELSKKKVHLFELRNVLKTDSKATPLLDEIKKKAPLKLVDPIDKGHCFVTQDFTGQTLQGETTTLGRGGPDDTASLLAKTLELATFGAKIRHPTTLSPAIKCNIPVFVESGHHPERGGTWIKKFTKNSPLIRALTLKKGPAILTFKNPLMVIAYGFLAKIFSVFETHKMSVDTITTSEISVAMTVDLKTLEQQELVLGLQKLGTVEIEKDLSLISLVRNKIKQGQRVFNALQSSQEGQKQINVWPFSLGFSKHHFCFLMKRDEVLEAISKLHEVLPYDTKPSTGRPL